MARGSDEASADTQPRFERVRRFKVADAVAAQLRRLVETGEYSPGDALPPERVLAENFGVGRSSMREALRSLESEGFITITHGVGAFVVDKTKDPVSEGSSMLVVGEFTVPELFEVREPLERTSAGLAARRITPEEVERLRAILARAEEPSISDHEFVELDSELHLTIAEASRNPLLVGVMRSLCPYFFAYSEQVLQLPERRAHAHQGHIRIVDAIAAKKVTEARSAAVAHIRDVEQDIVAALDATK